MLFYTFPKEKKHAAQHHSVSHLVRVEDNHLTEPKLQGKT